MREQIYLPKKNEYIQVMSLTWDRIDEAKRLRDWIWEQLEDKSWFAKAGREDFVKTMDDGFGLAAFAHNKMIACLLCTLDGVEYGVDRKYRGEELGACADFVDIYIHPDYRGNGLQNILEEMMCGICKRNGKTILLGTVSPENVYSYQNFIRAGYREVDRMIKYEGLDRIFMEKRLV